MNKYRQEAVEYYGAKNSKKIKKVFFISSILCRDRKGNYLYDYPYAKRKDRALVRRPNGGILELYIK